MLTASCWHLPGSQCEDRPSYSCPGSGRYTSQGRVWLWEWVLYQGRPVHHTTTMPLMLELKYEYFIADWPGRIKLTELVLGLLCMMCAAPAYEGVQHWFLLVVVVAFLGTVFFSLYYLCLAEPLNKLQVNWLMGEFWFTAATTFFYFTAFVAMLAHFCEYDGGEYQYWVDAQIAAGVLGLLNDIIYGLGAYLIYVDWKKGPVGVAAPPAAQLPA